MSEELWRPVGEIDPTLEGYKSTGQVIVNGEIVAEWRDMGAREWTQASASAAWRDGWSTGSGLRQGMGARRVLASLMTVSAHHNSITTPQYQPHLAPQISLHPTP